MKRALYWVLAGAIGALAVHIAIIFLIPRLSTRDLTSRLQAVGPSNSISMIGAAKLPELINFADTSVLYAVCPFDLKDGPIALVAQPGETPMSLVFLVQGGIIFSALTDRAAAQGLLQVRLLTKEQLDDLVDSEDGSKDSPELRIEAPKPTGVILIKALVSTASRMPGAEAALARTRCGSL
jgi:uncharacterized membrane protein